MDSVPTTNEILFKVFDGFRDPPDLLQQAAMARHYGVDLQVICRAYDAWSIDRTAKALARRQKRSAQRANSTGLHTGDQK
jgi:hypothetical protein